MEINNKVKNTSSNKSYRILITMLMLSYISIYFFNLVTPIFNWIAIIYSYYLIIVKRQFFPIPFLLVSNLTILGFALYGYYRSFVAVITIFFPPILYIMLNKKRLSLSNAKLQYPVIIFLGFLILQFLLNFSVAKPLFLRQIFPLILYCLYISLENKDRIADIRAYTVYFRMIFLVSLVLFFLPNYTDLTIHLFNSGELFGTDADLQSIGWNDLNRNIGICFDCRTFATYSYVYFYLKLRSSSIEKIDWVLVSLVLLTSASRGPILVFLCIIMAYFWNQYKYKIVLPAMLLIIPLSYGQINEDSRIYKIIETIDITKEGNALEQRSVFSLYSLNAFYLSPVFGQGFGELTASDTKKRQIDAGHGVYYDVVTDAYLFSLLGELGCVGGILFIFSFWKTIVPYKPDVLNIALFLGMLIQLTGTDLPNMCTDYFCFLVLILKASKFNNIIIQ